MSLTFHSEAASLDSWGEPVVDKGDCSPVALAAFGMACLGFACGPLRWMPLFHGIDLTVLYPLGSLAMGLSLLLLIPGLAMGYIALFGNCTPNAGGRVFAWLALLIIWMSLYCWFGVIAQAIELPRLEYSIGLRFIALSALLHTVAMAGDSKAGTYVAGGLVCSILVIALVPSWIVESRFEARRQMCLWNLNQLANPLEQDSLADEEPSHQQLSLESHFVPRSRHTGKLLWPIDSPQASAESSYWSMED